jgi:hypothetical protein
MGNVRVSWGSLRLVLLAFFATGLLLTPAARASAEDFSLTIDVVGEGTVECEVDGGFAELCEDEYPEETEVSLVAEPEFEWEFAGWSGDCSADACDLFMDEDHEVTATFEPIPPEEFTLTIGTDGTGTGKVECELQEGPVPCASKYPEETEVTLIPVPGAGSEFIEFSGDCEGSECELTMEADTSVTATFDLVGPALTIVKAGSGSGTVKCEVESGPLEACAPAYLEGTELVLVASASSGSQFAGWSGDCSADPCELVMDEARAVTATFNLIPAKPDPGDGEENPPPPPPPPGKLSVSGAALYQGGKAVLKLSCKGRGACKGSLKLVAKLKVKGKLKNVEIGKASFRLAAGASKTLKVKLSGAAKKVLGKANAVKAKVSGTGVTKSTVTIKPTAR